MKEAGRFKKKLLRAGVPNPQAATHYWAVSYLELGSQVAGKCVHLLARLPTTHTSQAACTRAGPLLVCPSPPPLQPSCKNWGPLV